MVGIRRVTDAAQVEKLAADLNGGRRARPAVVVSTPRGQDGPWIDAERIASELDRFADVFVLGSDCAWEFTSVMPHGTQVYGGAGRVYPVGLSWVHDPTQAPLRFAYAPADGQPAATALIDDGFRAALSAGLLSTRPTTPGSQPVRGKVLGCPTPSQGLIELVGGGYATVQVGALFPGDPAGRVLAVGMPVAGALDPVTRQLDLRPSLPDPAAGLEDVPDGTVLPALVGRVDGGDCEVFLHPRLPVRLTREQVTAGEDDLRDLLSEGEVIAVRLLRGPDGAVRPTGRDLDVAACGPALALLPGGPPWLPAPDDGLSDEAGEDDRGPVGDPVPAPATHARTEGTPQRNAPPPIAKAAAPASPRPKPTLLDRRVKPIPEAAAPTATSAQAKGRAVQDLGLALEASRVSERATRIRLRQAEAELLLLEQELAQARKESDARDHALKKLRRLHRRSREQEYQLAATQATVGSQLFLDGEEQLRFEVHVRWAHRIPAAEKQSRPLRPYTLGPQFLTSLEQLQGIDRDKVIDVVVEVLTGLAETSAGREMHPLRAGTSGNEQALRRDGQTCWRVALQRNTPSARRLHFWRGATGIELSRVVRHDDFSP
jgi:hypothetical protein